MGWSPFGNGDRGCLPTMDSGWSGTSRQSSTGTGIQSGFWSQTRFASGPGFDLTHRFSDRAGLHLPHPQGSGYIGIHSAGPDTAGTRWHFKNVSPASTGGIASGKLHATLSRRVFHTEDRSILRLYQPELRKAPRVSNPKATEKRISIPFSHL
ncbi:MAG: hypothetical protein BWY82_02415 [Verrucomicrobia bacterium ADurb.Bin474]|nr:MAG: hypothetical protein BWY82_02415 [Verrucomicrobia bacterium ADurb.Bin474]